MHNQNHTIAYFSLEIGLEPFVPTYSGGLGVLAGDTLRAGADLGLPMAGVTLLYRDGYFTQRIVNGEQIEDPTGWKPEEVLEQLPTRAYVPIEGRLVYIRCFRTMLRGATGRHVPVYFLDTDYEDNAEQDRKITRALYTGNTDWRIKQEAVLGIGGRRMLRSISHDVSTFHMNEGHACFLTVELLSEHLARFEKSYIDEEAIRHAKSRCVFTTHTPIEAGHDRFSIERVRAIIGDHPVFHRPDIYGKPGELNTTLLALNLSRSANAVARKHGEVSRAMFPGYPIQAITNGVHAASWASPAMTRLFDERVPHWRTSNAELRLLSGCPSEDLWKAHMEGKKALVQTIKEVAQNTFDPDAFTIGFARRATGYKRPAMLVSDLARLRKISKSMGPVQVVYAGKAHPHDGIGKSIIKSIHEAIGQLSPEVRVVFLPNYDIGLARKIVQGVDLWLNTPEPPLEASGTSGMKAALNGIPQLSTLDGWWIEGCVEGVTGWGIGTQPDLAARNRPSGAELYQQHAAELYRKLEENILPLYYKQREKWINVMRSAIAINGSYFTTERMVREYITNAYFD